MKIDAHTFLSHEKKVDLKQEDVITRDTIIGELKSNPELADQLGELIYQLVNGKIGKRTFNAQFYPFINEKTKEWEEKIQSPPSS